MKLRILTLIAIIAACGGSLAQDHRPSPIIYIPPCSNAEMGLAIRAYMSPTPTPTPIPTPAPEYCAEKVCEARASHLAAIAYTARTLDDYQKKMRMDHAALACGY